jgi:hypothetical protein
MIESAKQTEAGVRYKPPKFSGVHPKIASERRGHSRVGITLDLYGHVLLGMQEDAAARVDEALRSALERHVEKIG